MSATVPVHVVDMQRAPFLCDEFLPLLSDDERRRAERLRLADKRAESICARGCLRQLLGRHLDRGADQLRFAYGPRGKPHLTDDTAGWSFNISHSQHRLVVACSPDLQLGVDVEYRAPDCAYQDLARRFFAADEFRAIMLHRPEQQALAFYTCWTAKEAYLKCTGTGIDRPLASFVIGKLEELDCPCRIVHGPDGPLPECIHPIDAGRGYTAHLACAASAPLLARRDHTLARLAP
ncbi:MAG: 4'-phosphopantetheinyl transferase family protein [Planctomycetota bacterium]